MNIKESKKEIFNSELFEHVSCNLCGASSQKAGIIYEADPDKIPRSYEEFINVYSSASTEVFYEQLLRCKICGLIYLSPRPKTDIIIEGYSCAEDEQYVSQERGRMHTFKNAISLLKKSASGGRLLDIGAAAGMFVKVAKDAGYDAMGIEPSEWMCGFAKKHYGVKVQPGTIEDAHLEENSFDVVTMWDVLEHVSDPMSTLKEVNRVLKPGGILLINYPNIDDPLAKLFGRKWWFLLSVHLVYFTPKTLLSYMKKTGFNKIIHRLFIQRLEYSYLVGRLEVYSKALASIAKAPYLIPGFKNLLIPYFASQYLMISRKEI